MPREIDREGLRRMVEAGAQLVEVLPAEEYAEDPYRERSAFRSGTPTPRA